MLLPSVLRSRPSRALRCKDPTNLFIGALYTQVYLNTLANFACAAKHSQYIRFAHMLIIELYYFTGRILSKLVSILFAEFE